MKTVPVRPDTLLEFEFCEYCVRNKIRGFTAIVYPDPDNERFICGSIVDEHYDQTLVQINEILSSSVGKEYYKWCNNKEKFIITFVMPY